MSPTQRSIKLLRDEGYTVAIVEYWHAFAKQRRDLFGMFDLLCVREGETLAVQTTSGSSVSARVKKLTEHENLPAVRAAGWKLEIHGWRRLKSGWACRRVDLS